MYLHLILFGIPCVVVFLSFRKKHHEKKKFPPAAWTTPLIGCLPAVVSKNIAEEMLKIGKELGPVVSTHLGFKKLVIVNGVEAFKTALGNPSMAGRTDVLYKELLGGKGIIWNDDVKEIRKFIFKSSRNFEFTGNATESIIQEQITSLLQRLENTNGKPFLVKNIFNIPMLNAIFNLLLGSKIPHDDPAFQKAAKSVELTITLPNPIMRACVLYPPLLNWVPSCLARKDKLEGYLMDVLSLVEKHLQGLVVNRIPDQPRCFADALQDKINDTTNESSAFHHKQKQAAPIIFDLIFASIDTTAAMLEWIVLYLSQFPHVQQKVQSEIDDIVGTQRPPLLSDRSNMHFTLAVIHEIFRLSSSVPYSLRKATEDTTLMGYTIVKDTYVIGNSYGINMDPDLWENPKEFKPERFLDKNAHFVKSEHLFVFGYGKRSCLGEATARDQIFLFMTRLLQTFNILQEKKLSNFSGSMAAAWHCVDFKAKFVPRLQNKNRV